MRLVCFVAYDCVWFCCEAIMVALRRSLVAAHPGHLMVRIWRAIANLALLEENRLRLGQNGVCEGACSSHVQLILESFQSCSSCYF